MPKQQPLKRRKRLPATTDMGVRRMPAQVAVEALVAIGRPATGDGASEGEAEQPKKKRQRKTDKVR